MVQRNGARGVVDAKVHTPSGSSEECYVTDLDSGTRPKLRLLFGEQNKPFTSKVSVFFQTRTQSDSFPGRMESTLLTSSSMDVTSLEAPLKCEWETQG